MPSSTPELSRETLAVHQRNWCSWPVDQIGQLLCGIAEKDHEMYTRRAHCFRLPPAQQELLKKEMDKYGKGYLGVALAVDQPFTYPSQIVANPRLKLILQFHRGHERGFAWSTALQWEPFPQASVLSGQVHPLTTELFCQAYCRLPTQEIGQLFEGEHEGSVSRLMKFFFDADAPAIRDLVRGCSTYQLRIYLGASAPIPDHPYRLRPILQIAATGCEDSAHPGEDQRTVNFEFSRPCPPACGGGNPAATDEVRT